MGPKARPTTRQTRQTVLFASSQPEKMRPAVSQSVASQPVASQPAASQPAASQLSTIQSSTFIPFVIAKKSLQKSSPLWAYADLDADGNAPSSRIGDREPVSVFRSKPYILKGNKKVKEYAAPGSGAHFRDHLYIKHGIIVQMGLDAALEDHAVEAERITEMEDWNSNIRISKRDRSITAFSIDGVSVRGLFLNMVVTEQLPFRFAEAASVRAFIHYLNPYADRLLPMTGMSVRKDLCTTIRLRLPRIKKTIAQAKSKIHLIYDGWTSDNHMSLLGVQARFLDSNFRLQSILLGLPKLAESHTGLHMAETAFKMTEKYGLQIDWVLQWPMALATTTQWRRKWIRCLRLLA